MDTEAGLFIYDFFNVIVSGSIMLMLWYLIWPGFFEGKIQKEKVSTSVLVILAIILCYFLGMIIQEVGSIADRFLFKTKDRARSTFLKEIGIKEMKREIKIKRWKKEIKYSLKNNCIMENTVRLRLLQKYAREIMKETGIECSDEFSEEQIRYVYTRMEYQVSYIGKERKMEKLRALFSMARSMLICTGVSLILLGYTVLMKEEHFMQIHSFWWVIIIIGSFLLFYYRMQKTMRYMVLIMLGNYEADYYERKYLRQNSTN